METPTNDRSKPRLSSSQKKSRNSLDNSASKLVKTLIYREKIRKLNHYRSAKSKRAEILVKNRHIDNIENVEPEEKIEVDNLEYENNLLIDQTSENKLMKSHYQSVESEHSNEIKQPVIFSDNTQGISSKISSNIIRRINSIKNSIKNIANTNHTKPLKAMNVNAKQQSVDTAPMAQKHNKIRRSISVGGFSSSCQINKPSQLIKPLKKQESTSSVHFNRPMSSSLVNSKKSSFSSSSSSLSFRSHHNSSSSLSNKPVFKVSTKIQYNDAHLYRNVNFYFNIL